MFALTLRGLLVTLLFASSGYAADFGSPSNVSVETGEVTEAVAPGRAFEVTVDFLMNDGWHIYAFDAVAPEELGGFAFQTTIEVDSDTPFSVVKIDWPESHAWDAGGYLVDTYDGRATAKMLVLVSAEAAAEASELKLSVAYQACSEQSCEPPVTLQKIISVRIDPAGGGIIPGDVPVVPEDSLEFTLGGILFTGIIAALLLGFAGGFLLNLMPCVLPLLPIKIMGLEKNIGSFSRRVLYGFMIMLGAVSFMMTLGLLVALLKGFDTTSALFQSPFFTVAVGVFCGVMGISMILGKTIQLPSAVQGFNPLETTTLRGAFVYGILQTVLATACGAPLLGTGLAWALQQGSVVIVLMVFLSAGLGMGVPWLVLTAFPRLIAWLPKSGPWNDLMKQVMGMVMLASAFFFTGAGILATGMLSGMNAGFTVIHLWLTALTIVAASAWTVYSLFRLKTSMFRSLICIGVAAFVSFVSVDVVWTLTKAEWAIHEGSGIWRPFDREEFEAARRAGKVVVVDFTADWCINCKVMELRVLHDEGVQKFLEENEVVAFKADITRRSGASQDFMNEYWQGPPPLIAVFGPGLGEDPLLSDRGATETVSSFVGYVLKAKGTE